MSFAVNDEVFDLENDDVDDEEEDDEDDGEWWEGDCAKAVWSSSSDGDEPRLLGVRLTAPLSLSLPPVTSSIMDLTVPGDSVPRRLFRLL
jgi:hypothetical protein